MFRRRKKVRHAIHAIQRPDPGEQMGKAEIRCHEPEKLAIWKAKPPPIPKPCLMIFTRFLQFMTQNNKEPAIALT